VKRWLRAQVSLQLDELAGPVVLLDPDRLLTNVDLDELGDAVELIRVGDWAELRCAWDLRVRKPSSLHPVWVIVMSEDFQTASDLPWDVETEAISTIRIRWPVPVELRPLFRVVGDHADDIADAARHHRATSDVVTTAFKIRLGGVGDELDAIARLCLNPTTPTELWDALDGAFSTRLARDVVESHGDLIGIQNAWEDWLRNGELSPFADSLSQAPGALITMLSNGLLVSAEASAPELPHWTTLGATDPDPDVLIQQLLAVEPSLPVDAATWIDVAAWWGQVRAAVALQPNPPPSADAAWEAWERLDTEFAIWLQKSYGGTLLSSSSTPRALHQIAPFLARRVDAGAQIVLVVVDGMGFAQWQQLRTTIGIKVLHSTGCFAMIPTLTTNSRQAIFAGALPIEFADTITTTSAEPRRWTSFWSEHGLAERDVSFTRTLGVDSTDVPDLKGRAVGVVINAVDEMLHGAEVLGDRQVASGVELWARAGFLKTLIGRAANSGYEVWMTSDHGNLPTVPGHTLREGQTVYDAAGTRVRLYPNETLRARSAEFGIVWNPPGYPRGTRCPLFAGGRTGFHSGGSRVSHGGLSIDEVIVPFAQVDL